MIKIHWIIVSFFIVAGLTLEITSVFTNRLLWGPRVVGVLGFSLGIFCIIDHIIFKKRLKIWNQNKNSKRSEK